MKLSIFALLIFIIGIQACCSTEPKSHKDKSHGKDSHQNQQDTFGIREMLTLNTILQVNIFVWVILILIYTIRSN